MELGLRGQVAIVSGGSKGIGCEIAAQLAEEGVSVLLAARGAEALEAAVKEIKSAGGAALGSVAEMKVHADVRRAVATAEQAFGPVDIAISNVYPRNTKGLDNTADDDLAREFNDIVMSVVHLARAVIPQMKKRRWGRLINIGASTMKGPVLDFPPYCRTFPARRSSGSTAHSQTNSANTRSQLTTSPLAR